MEPKDVENLKVGDRVRHTDGRASHSRTRWQAMSYRMTGSGFV